MYCFFYVFLNDVLFNCRVENGSLFTTILNTFFYGEFQMLDNKLIQVLYYHEHLNVPHFYKLLVGSWNKYFRKKFEKWFSRFHGWNRIIMHWNKVWRHENKVFFWHWWEIIERLRFQSTHSWAAAIHGSAIEFSKVRG